MQTGPGCLIVAQAGVAGSTTLGHHVVLSGQVGVAGHVDIGDGVMAGAQCGITSSVEAGQIVLGSHAHADRPGLPPPNVRRLSAISRNCPGRLQGNRTPIRKTRSNPPKSDTAMPIVTITNLEKTFGSCIIFEHLDFQIDLGRRRRPDQAASARQNPRSSAC